MIESVQYSNNIKGSSRERLYKELGLESLIDGRWYRPLVHFYKIITSNTPEYIHDFLLYNYLIIANH